MDETPRVRRRWLWYGLPVLLGLIALLVAIGVSRFRNWFAVKLEQAERQRAAVEVIRRLGGSVGYDYERRHWDYQGRTHGSEGVQPPLPGPAWFRERYGLDMLATVESVAFSPRGVGDYDRLDDAGLQQLEEPLKALPHLSSLYISGKKVTDAGLKHLAGLSQVKSLHIYGTSITDSGLEHIQGLTQLEELSFKAEEAGITDDGLRYLAGLKNLKTLRLTESKITGPGLRHLEGLENLKSLTLDHAEITDAGLLKLGKLEGMPALEALGLSGTRVRGPGLRSLSGLPRLRTLSLRGTDVDDEGVEYLMDFHQLKKLDLGGTNVTQIGVGKLRDALGTWNTTIDGVP